MDEMAYMLRSPRTHIWHLPSVPGQTQWKTLCTMPIRGKEERLLLPNEPKPRDVLCPKCQQIKRAQEKKRAKAVEAAMVTNPE
jgi:hypothetical protein